MQAIYVLYTADHVMKLPYFIVITGFVCGLFAISVPNLSDLRFSLGLSTLFSLIYIVVAIVLSVRDGMMSNNYITVYIFISYLLANLWYHL